MESQSNAINSSRASHAISEGSVNSVEVDNLQLFVLLAHYRSPINFSESALDQAHNSLERIRQFVSILDEQLAAQDGLEDGSGSSEAAQGMDARQVGSRVVEARGQFLGAMENDLNAPYALRAVFELVRDMNRCMNENAISRRDLLSAKQLLAEFGEILGISFSPGKREPAGEADDQAGNLIELLMEVRQRLRERKDYALADEIRNRLMERGVVLEDAKESGGKYSLRLSPEP
jgi:cysteinyl-tRNA synthetase